MQEPQPDDAEEAVGHGRAEVIATRVFRAVAVALVAVWLGCLSAAGVWSRNSSKVVVSGPCRIIILIMPFLVWSVFAMLWVVLFRIRDSLQESQISMIPRCCRMAAIMLTSQYSHQYSRQWCQLFLTRHRRQMVVFGPAAMWRVRRICRWREGAITGGVRGRERLKCLERRSAMAEDRMLDEDRWC